MQTEKTDQTGWMPRLICDFAGHKCHFIGFVMRRLILFKFYDNHSKFLGCPNFLIFSDRQILPDKQYSRLIHPGIAVPC